MVTSVVFVKATMTSKELTTRETIGDVYCLNKNCNGEKCVLMDAHVTTPRSIDGFRKCGAWLLAYKVTFTLAGKVKTTKTDETRFLFAKKDQPVT